MGKTQLSESKKQISSLEALLEEKKIVITNLQSVHSSHLGDIANLEATIADKERQFKILETDFKNQLSSMDQKIKNDRNLLKTAESKVSELSSINLKISQKFDNDSEELIKITKERNKLLLDNKGLKSDLENANANYLQIKEKLKKCCQEKEEKIKVVENYEKSHESLSETCQTIVLNLETQNIFIKDFAEKMLDLEYLIEEDSAYLSNDEEPSLGDQIEEIEDDITENTLIKQADLLKKKYSKISKKMEQNTNEIRSMRNRLKITSVDYRHVHVQTDDQSGIIGFQYESYSCNVNDTEMNIPITRSNNVSNTASYKWEIISIEESDLNPFETSPGHESFAV